MTPQRRTRIRELAETNQREVVRQALVLLAQEREQNQRQGQEELRAKRTQAAQALLEHDPQPPTQPHA